MKARWPQLSLLLWSGLLSSGCFAGAATAVQFDEAKLPPAPQRTIDFDQEIKPLFESRCYRCHGLERPKSNFRLLSRESALKGGAEGVDIVPGQSARSPLIYYVARVVADMEMPPPGKGEPLTAEQVGVLRAWIDQGAAWSKTPVPPNKLLFSVEPSFAWIHVSGDQQQFREQWGLKDGWSGGIRDFRLEETSATGVMLSAEGKALANQDDYALKLRLEKRDLGFMRFGYEQFRRYYDDTGGFYEPFAGTPLALGRDLSLDIGRAYFDVGLTLPNWPRIVLGYEYQFKEGAKSSLAWSDVSPAIPTSGVDPVAIFPSFKDINEHTHILKLDIDHEIRGVRLEDSFRAEFYDLNNRRTEYDALTLGDPLSKATTYREDYNHFQAVNAIRLEKQVRDWLLLGGGYLYSKLDGDAEFKNQSFLLPTHSWLDPFEVGQPITIRRESHIWNLSSLWGSWDGLSLSAGLQNEWTHEEGFGQGLLPDLQHVFGSQRDKAILQEDAGLRYTKIPFTVLFADARFRQEWIDSFDTDRTSVPQVTDFLVDTDARNDLKDFRTGFTVSPWSRVSLEGSYRRSFETTDYSHPLDVTFVDSSTVPGLFSGNGYPGFFRRRDIKEQQVEGRLVLRPARWLKTSLKYQLVATDYRTVTDSSVLLGEGTMLPGGSIFAGNYDANIYSINAVLTPWRRLTWSTSFSYSDTRTVTGVNGKVGIVPYAGNIYSVLSSANLRLGNSTDASLSYTFSRADYRQDNADQTLPLGIEYNRHGLISGLSRQFGKRMSAHLQYGFFYYDEPTSGGARDFTAHAVFGSWRVLFN